MNKRPIVLIASFFLLAFQIKAQENKFISLTDIDSNPIRLYEADQDNKGPYVLTYQSEKSLLYGTLGLFGVGLLIQQTNKADPFTVAELDLLDPNKINGFDRGATTKNSQNARTASDILYRMSFALPSMVFALNKKTRDDVFPLFVLGAEAFIITGGINLLAKHIFNRTRPYTYNSSFSLETRTGGSSRLSFFSGHTSQAAAATFFLAKVIGDYHPDMNKGLKVAMWTTAVVYPAFTGYLRIESGRHFNTDVIAGYAIGATMGWLIPHLNKKRNSSIVSVEPFSAGGAAGLSCRINLN